MPDLSARAHHLAGELALIANVTIQPKSRAAVCEDVAASIGWEPRRLWDAVQSVSRQPVRPTTRAEWLAGMSWLVGDEERLPPYCPPVQSPAMVARAKALVADVLERMTTRKPAKMAASAAEEDDACPF